MKNSTNFAGFVLIALRLTVTVTSSRRQDVTLIARHSIEDIGVGSGGVLAAPHERGMAKCDLHLPEKTRVTIHLKLGTHNPNEWICHMASA